MSLLNPSDSNKINQVLDEVLLNFLDEIEEYFSIRCQVDKCLSEGYISMAKTRCITGVNSVSRLQYNLIEDSRAKFKVNVNYEEKAESDKSIDFFQETKLVFNLKDSEIEDLETKFQEKLKTNDDKDGKNVKKRKNFKGKDDENKEERENETNISEKTTLTTESHAPTPSIPNQPLKWFGILVPRSLRHSQQCFVKATHLICQLAECQSNVGHLIKHYRKLMKLKDGV